MTRARLRRELSGDEYAGWMALWNLRSRERKADEAKQKRSGKRIRGRR